MSAPFIIGLVLVAMVIVGIVGYQQARKRREALTALAMSLGWTFDPSNDYSWDDRYPQFQMFHRGEGRHAFNTLIGTIAIDGVECRAQAGDYQYKTTSGTGKDRRTTTHRFSYLVVHLPYPATPRLLVRSETFLDKFAGALGFDDIDFESEEFSRAFHVKSADRKFAYDVCHPRMMEFLLATRPPPVEIEQGCCCVSDASRTWSPEQFAQRIRWASEFFSLWPDYLKSDLSSPTTNDR